DSPLDHYIVGQAEPSAPDKSKRPSREALPPKAMELKPEGTAPFASLARAEAIDFLTQFEDESSEIIGSNNFVVSGAHTASGKPLLANDTHFQLSTPALGDIVHLTAPGMNVEGFALPGAPLVIIGHNERIAWGFTNSNADVEDLYIENLS